MNPDLEKRVPREILEELIEEGLIKHPSDLGIAAISCSTFFF